MSEYASKSRWVRIHEYVSDCVYNCECNRECMQTCMRLRVYVCMRVCMYEYACEWVCICMSVNGLRTLSSLILVSLDDNHKAAEITSIRFIFKSGDFKLLLNWQNHPWSNIINDLQWLFGHGILFFFNYIWLWSIHPSLQSNIQRCCSVMWLSWKPCLLYIS